LFKRITLSFCFIFSITSAAWAVDKEQDCVACHVQQVSDWQKSDHAKAMAEATENSVLGDFSGAEMSHYSQHARFFTQDGQFKIAFTEDSKTSIYQVKYTFGHYPLQQYLIEAAGGRFQVFPFAWDARTKENSGQRWYPIYPQEDIKSADRLHWQQPMQTWNGMCADCHSDGLTRNYSKNDNTFNTQWDNISIGCQSCHGKMQEHATQSQRSPLTLTKEEKQAIGHCLRAPNEKVASWQGQPRDPAGMDSCFACHSLRSPLTDGIKPDTAFLDQFSPSLLSQPFYYADGQIKEEVYVYGSFLQSKMFAAGVTCLDCHDKHTMKIKVQGNGLCLQCHSPETYQQNTHLRHPLNSEASQCVSCHMPETVYMGVDFRRDHSLRIPRPDLSVQTDIPNACNKCHQNESAAWATEQVKKWHGPTKKLSKEEQAFFDLQQQGYLPVAEHFALINDVNISVIKRASALMMLPNSVSQLSDIEVKPWVTSEHDLIRLAVAKIGQLLPINHRLKSYQSLLGDRYKAIRIAAANNLLDVGLQNTSLFRTALEELMTSNQVNQWRGEGNLNQSMVHMQLNDIAKAIEALSHGIASDPYFAENYINLADIYRAEQNNEKERETLVKGLNSNPKSALLHYSHGMYLIRQQEKTQAVSAFKQAIKYEPNNLQYAYVYLLALDNSGQTKRAINDLKLVIKQFSYPPQLLDLGLSFSQKIGDNESYHYFLNLK